MSFLYPSCHLTFTRGLLFSWLNKIVHKLLQCKNEWPLTNSFISNACIVLLIFYVVILKICFCMCDFNVYVTILRLDKTYINHQHCSINHDIIIVKWFIIVTCAYIYIIIYNYIYKHTKSTRSYVPISHQINKYIN